MRLWLKINFLSFWSGHRVGAVPLLIFKKFRNYSQKLKTMDALQIVIVDISVTWKLTSNTSLESSKYAILYGNIGFAQFRFFYALGTSFCKNSKKRGKKFSTQNIEISPKYEIFSHGPKMPSPLRKTFSKIFVALLPPILDLLRFIWSKFDKIQNRI